MPEPATQPVAHVPPHEAPRFLADAMLERLARWLRVLGYDVLSAGPAGVATILEQGGAANRVILTRNHAFAVPGEHGGSLLIRHHAPLDQLREVIAHLHLVPPWRLFTRCLICNTLLLPAASIIHQLPDAQGSPPSHRCPTCGRLYWEGVHTRRMRAALQSVLGTGIEGAGD